ncbi:MAG: hypothetical protein ACE5R4_15525, partial [Armatimonadota bacterium]
MAEALAAGTGSMVITPPLGTPMSGYFHTRYSEGVLDDLLAQALALEAEDGAAIIISCDLIALGAAACDEIRAEVSRETGVPREGILIACTHTHTGPVTQVLWYGERNQEYLEVLPELIASAGIMAWRGRQPAAASWTVGSAPHLAFNRRFRMKDGSVRTNPGVLNPDIVEPVAPIDPGVRILRIDDVAGRPLALVVNYALHLDTHGGSKISADFPYFLRQTLAGALSPPPTTLFLNGTCGDINHIDVKAPRESGRQVTQRIGTSLAAEVLRALPRATPIEQPLINYLSRKMTFPIRVPTEAALARAREALGENWRSIGSCYVEVERGDRKVRRLDVDRHVMREALFIAEMERKELEVELGAMRIGPLGLATIPGEVFVKLGLAIQEQSPFDPTMVAELVNGTVGYIATREAYDQGSYEVTLRRSACIAPGAGESIVEAC